MKTKFIKQSLVKQRVSEVFDQQIQQINDQSQFQKSSAIRTQDIQFPSFKKGMEKQKIIQQQNSFNLPGLRKFFERKQVQIMNKSQTKYNFKNILKSEESNKLLSVNNITSQQASRISRSSNSSVLKRKANLQQQFKKISQQNKHVRDQYQRKLKRQTQLNQFQKKLLKEQKNRYMMKIQQLQGQLQNLHRQNYKIKQQEQISRLKQIKQFDKYSQLPDASQNIINGGKTHDYYQPYVMNTKHNDLKKLMDQKAHSPNKDQDKIKTKNIIPFTNLKRKQKGKISQISDIDELGNQLQKQIKLLQQQRSSFINKSQSLSKKQKSNYLQPNGQNNQMFKQFQQNYNNRNNQLGYQNKNKKLDQTQQEDNQILKDLEIMQANSNKNRNYNQKNSKVNNIHAKQFMNQSKSMNLNSISQIKYKPETSYSFTKNQNQINQYSLSSSKNMNNFDTFQMTKTYLDLQQGEQSLTNKYIDSKTSTRNKVGFFKDSLILIKTEKFEVAFKKSSLIQTSKDRCRIIFFAKNNTKFSIKIKFNYEYDSSYFKLKVHQKISIVNPLSQSKEDLQIYHYSQNDLNQVIDILIQIDGQKYGLWMPISWIQFEQNQNFKMPHYNQQISILPDRQFKNYQTAKHILPLMYGGKDGISQWAYLYGKSKFGSCYVKLTWQQKQIKIQTNAKWIDLLAFIMHHIK